MKTPPTTDRGRMTVESILDAASLLFYHHGVRATSLDQVSALSSTGRSQLYHYFSDKADLVLSVIERQVERVLEAQQPILGDIAHGKDLQAWRDLVIRLHADSDDPIRCPLGALVVELAEDDPTARAALCAGFKRWRDALTRGLKRIRDNGELASPLSPAVLGVGLLAAYQGGVLLSQAADDLAPLRAALDTAVSSVLGDRPARR